MLFEDSKSKLLKRRTVLSTALAVLEDPACDFSLECAIGQRRPSDNELLGIFSDILSSDSDSLLDESVEDTSSVIDCRAGRICTHL